MLLVVLVTFLDFIGTFKQEFRPQHLIMRALAFLKKDELRGGNIIFMNSKATMFAGDNFFVVKCTRMVGHVLSPC